jgi:hypothetical protein
MADRTCENCNKVFDLPCRLKVHLARKTPCAPIINLVTDAAGGNCCKFCGRRYTTRQALSKHIKRSCKIAGSDEGMDKLFEHTLQRQLATQDTKINKLTEMVEKLAATANVQYTTNISISINPWDGASRIILTAEQMAAAVAENSRIQEYACLGDHAMTDPDVAPPYVSDLFMELTKRAHSTPEARNVYLNPRRADQVLVHMAAGNWEVLTLTDATQEIFDSLAGRIHRVILTDVERKKLPREAQNALSYAEMLYRVEPAEYVRAARAPMMAHLQNTTPAATGCN